MDLLHDMAHAEAFLIDGESLVCEALCFCRSSSQLLGGQPLSVAFYAERLLQQLLVRGGTFTVVFYKAMDAVWQKQPAAFALRQMLRTHLQLVQQHLSDTTGAAGFSVQVLPSFWTRSWQEHMANLQPKFVMVTDTCLEALDSGSNRSSSSSNSAQQSATSNAAPMHIHEALLLQSLQYLAVAGLDLVYLGQLQFDPLTALGFLVGARKTYRHMRSQAPMISSARRQVLTAVFGIQLSRPGGTSAAVTAVVAAESEGETETGGATDNTGITAAANSGKQLLLSSLMQDLCSSRLAVAVLSCCQVLAGSSTRVLQADQYSHGLSDQHSAMCPAGGRCTQHVMACFSTQGEAVSSTSSIAAPADQHHFCCACWYAAVYLLHVVLLQQLPLQLRAQPLQHSVPGSSSSSTPPQVNNAASGRSNNRLSSVSSSGAMGNRSPAVPPAAASFSRQLSIRMGEVLPLLPKAADSTSSSSAPNSHTASAGSQPSHALDLQALAKETADGWDGHLYCWLMLQLAAATCTSEAQQQPETGRQLGGLLSGVKGEVASALAAGFACLAQLLDGTHTSLSLSTTASTASSTPSQPAFANASNDATTAAANLAAFEQLLLTCVPLEVQHWARSLPASQHPPAHAAGPREPVVSQITAAPASGSSAGGNIKAAGLRPELLSSMKAGSQLLSRMFGRHRQGEQPQQQQQPAELADLPVHSSSSSSTLEGAVKRQQLSASSSSSSSSHWGEGRDGGSISDIDGSSRPEVGTSVDASGSSLFGISVFEEKWHWHFKKELEPAFWTEVGCTATGSTCVNRMRPNCMALNVYADSTVQETGWAGI